MLIRSTWTLSLSESAVLPRAYNLELVKRLHEQLGIEMGSSAIPSISYSGILGYYSSSRDFLTFQSNEFYSLSLCGLQEVAGQAISSLNLFPSLEFLGAKFDVINREDEITSYEELYTNLVANEPEPVKRFELQFRTPTAFTQNRVNLPLPLPSLMFRSWLERWNNFAPVYLGSDELIVYLNGAIALSQHKIHTTTFAIQKGYVSGFIGNVRLKVLHHTDPLLANVANLLVQYSQFAGTGVKTRLGMGQTDVKLES